MTPSSKVPTYSLSSLIKRSCILVPRPITISKSPVAKGSRVPQCPTFCTPKRWRTVATTSWLVIGASLSTRSNPSRVLKDFIAEVIDCLGPHFCERAANPRSGRELMTAAARGGAYPVRIYFRVLRPDADPNALVRKFFEEDCHHDRIDAPDYVDQPINIRGVNGQSLLSFLSQAEGCDAIIRVQSLTVQQST